jgi:hypothetical protein
MLAKIFKKRKHDYTLEINKLIESKLKEFQEITNYVKTIPYKVKESSHCTKIQSLKFDAKQVQDWKMDEILKYYLKLFGNYLIEIGNTSFTTHAYLTKWINMSKRDDFSRVLVTLNFLQQQKFYCENSKSRTLKRFFEALQSKTQEFKKECPDYFDVS